MTDLQKLVSEIAEFNEAKAKYIKTRYAKRYKYAPNLKEETADVIIAGLNLLKYPEYSDVSKVRNLLGVFEEKDKLMNVISSHTSELRSLCTKSPIHSSV